MSSTASIEIVKEIVERASKMLVRYIIEVSKPPLVGQRDPDALSRIEDLERDGDLGIRALSVLLGHPEHLASSVQWPMDYTSFNFLLPRYLLVPVADEADGALEQIEGLIAELERLDADAGWPEAVEVARDLVTGQRGHVEKLRELAAEIGELRAEPGTGRGTSASRW